MHPRAQPPDSAFEWLDRAIDLCDPIIMAIKSYSFFDAIRSDPRYFERLRRMNLEPWADSPWLPAGVSLGSVADRLKPVTGVYAALLTPRSADGKVDESALERNLRFCLSAGVRGFVLNGATGEYCLTTSDELRRMLAVGARVCAGQARFGAGVGSAGLQRSVELARLAFDSHASFVLAPAPSFFPYSPEDVACFCSALAAAVPGPVLLYNIPQFTSEIPPAVVLELLAGVPNIAGIKDSSGSLEILRAVSAGRPDACRIVGNDEVLVEALAESLCDGIISGIAGVLPELIRFLFEGNRGGPARFLSELIARMSPLPVPWGLKWLAEARELFPATFSQPASAQRVAQGEKLQQWFRSEWHAVRNLL